MGLSRNINEMNFSDGVTSGKYDISIAAVNRTSGRVLAETIFSLTVLSGSRMITVFQQKLFTKVFRKGNSRLNAFFKIFLHRNIAALYFYCIKYNSFTAKMIGIFHEMKTNFMK